jgi:hypothetical protein
MLLQDLNAQHKMAEVLLTEMKGQLEHRELMGLGNQ